MKLDARELGVEGTLDRLRQLLVTQFAVPLPADSLPVDEPLFAAGIGLSSMEGMELLMEVERIFGVEVNDVEAWVDESPTLLGVARYIVENSPRRTQNAS